MHIVTSYLDPMRVVIPTLALPSVDRGNVGVEYDFIVSLLMQPSFAEIMLLSLSSAIVMTCSLSACLSLVLE